MAWGILARNRDPLFRIMLRAAEETMARTSLKARRRSAPAKKHTTPQRAPAAKASAAPKRKARPKHAFTVSHPRDEDFKDGGLRGYVQYRDLGIAIATRDAVVAHVL